MCPKNLDFLKPRSVSYGSSWTCLSFPVSISQARNLQTRDTSVTRLRGWTKESAWLARKLTCHTASSLFTSQSSPLVGERGCSDQKITAKKSPTHVVVQRWCHLSSRCYKCKTLQVPSCENHRGVQPQCSKWERTGLLVAQSSLWPVQLFISKAGFGCVCLQSCLSNLTYFVLILLLSLNLASLTC